MFNHVKLESLNFDLQAVTTDSGRKYTTPDGKVYPSITTVLSSYNKKALFERRARVGEEEANRVARKASNRGTKLHSTVEKYLLNELSSLKMHMMMPDTKELFLKLKPFLDAHAKIERQVRAPNLHKSEVNDFLAQSLSLHPTGRRRPTRAFFSPLYYHPFSRCFCPLCFCLFPLSFSLTNLLVLIS